MLSEQRNQRGFTLIEAMVVVAILGLLVVIAAPSLSAYTENSKVRGVAESFVASAQKARLEAIRTNQNAQLVLTSDDPIAANVATTNTSATAGNWIVRRVSDDATPVITFVEGRSIREGANRSDGASSVTVGASSNSTALASITFNSAGATSLGAAWTVNFGSSSAACAPTGSVRCLRVVISVSGQIRTCDPAAASGDTRACP
jgi:type IV fimbrial biogenesis protein FimT